MKVYLGNRGYCQNCPYLNNHKWYCNACKNYCKEIAVCPCGHFNNLDDKFPVLLNYKDKEYGKISYYVPFSLIKEHEDQCMINHYQDAETLKNRGGLSWHEMYYILNDKVFDDVKSDYEGAVEYIVTEYTLKQSQIENSYIVPVEWSMSGFVRIQANSIEEAIKKVHINRNKIKLPDNYNMVSYIEDSFDVSSYDDIENCKEMCKSLTERFKKSGKISMIGDIKNESNE